MLLHMTRHFSVLGKPCKRLLTNLRVYLQNITLLLSASSSRQQLTAVVTHFPFHKPQLQYDTPSTLYPFSRWGILGAIMKYIANLRQLTTTTCSCCFYLSCFLYNHMFLCLPLSQPPLPKAKRHLYTDGNVDTYSIQFISIVGVAIGFASSIHMIPEM